METIIRAVIAYWVLFLMLRITGRRVGERLTPFEILVLFLTGGQMTQAIIASDRSMTNAVLGVFTIALMHALAAFLKLKSDTFCRVADGTPVLIYADGQWLEDRMTMLRVQKEDVLASARESGVEKPEKIQYAIVERNGGISIIKKDGDE